MTLIEILMFMTSLLLGYLLGSINPGYLIGRMKRIDIREVGTKNPGTSNVWHTLGKKYGILTATYDIFKSLISCLISIYILGLDYYLAQFSGIMAILGHCFPFYLKFRGGKGVAAAIGMLPYYVSMYMSTSDPFDLTMIYIVLFLVPVALLFIYLSHLLSMLAWIIFPLLGYASILYYPGNEFNIFFLLILTYLLGFVTYSAIINKKFPLKDKIFRNDWIRLIIRLFSIGFLILYDVFSKNFSLNMILFFIVLFVSVDLWKILKLKSNTQSKKIKFSSYSIYVVAFYITVLIFPREIAFSSIIFLIFGDTFEKILGLGFGRHKLLDKSLEGILAYTGCMCLCVYVLNTIFNISIIILIIGAIAAILTELFSIEMNENFTIPLISATLMYAVLLAGF